MDYFTTDEEEAGEANYLPACITGCEPAQQTKTYMVIDRHTGQQVGGTYKSRVRASRRVDQLDNAYGAYRYAVRTVYAD